MDRSRVLWTRDIPDPVRELSESAREDMARQACLGSAGLTRFSDRSAPGLAVIAERGRFCGTSGLAPYFETR